MNLFLHNIKNNSLKKHLQSISDSIYGYGNASHAFKDILDYLKPDYKNYFPNIIMPSFIPAKLYRTVLAAGYEPKFYEISGSCEFNLNDIKKLVDENTRAVFVIHYFGHPANIEDIKKMTDEKELVLIEDCAHVLDGESKSGKMGSIGDFSLFSPRKMQMLSDGGMLVINRPVNGFNPAYQKRVKSFYTAAKFIQSRTKHFIINLFSGNDPLRLSRIPRVGYFNPAKGNVFHIKNISFISELVTNSANIRKNSETRKNNYNYLYDSLRNFSCLTPLYKDRPDKWTPYSFPVLVDADKRDILQREMLRAGISCGKGWPESPFETTLAGTKELSEKILELPIYPLMEKKQLDRIIYVCTSFGYKLITGHYLLPSLTTTGKNFSKQKNAETNKVTDIKINYKVITTEREFDQLENEWDDLCEQVETHIFQTYQWQRIWWRHFGRNKRLNIILFYSEYKLVGIAPFFIDTYRIGSFSIIKRLRLIGSGFFSEKNTDYASEYGVTDYLDIIIQRGFENDLTNCLLEYLNENPFEYDIAQLEEISSDSNIIKWVLPGLNALGWKLKIMKGEICPRLRVPGSVEEFMKDLNARQRYKFSRIRKNNQNKTYFEIKTVETEKELQRDFNEFVWLHQQRWKRQGEKGAFADGNYKLFLKEITGTFLKRGYLHFTSAYSGDKCLAVECAFRYKDYLYDYLKAFNDKSPLAKKRPGKALLLDAIEKAIKQKIKIVDLLRGSEEYKFEIASEWQWTYKLTITNPSHAHNYRYRIFLALSILLNARYRLIKEFNIAYAQLNNFGLRGLTRHYFPRVIQKMKNRVSSGITNNNEIKFIKKVKPDTVKKGNANVKKMPELK